MSDEASPDPMGTDIHYPCGAPPATGVPLEIAQGVHWVRLPLPASLGAINVWLLADDDGQALVDTGIFSEDSVALWEKLLAGPLVGGRLTRILATHLHPDHVGMAGWLTRRTGCRLWMTRLEYLQCRMLAGDTGRAAPEDAVGFYHRAGWDDQALAAYGRRFGSFGRMLSPLPDSYRRVREGELVHIGEYNWEVVVGAGHSPEHACLYDARRKLLISGDQVLPRISSNVSVHPTEPDADPLGDWLHSLGKLRRRVPDAVLVLPSHNEPFHGLHARLTQLETDALDALDRLRQGLTEPRRAVDVFPLLFSAKLRTEDPSQLTLATGEAIAHLNHLLIRNEISVSTDECGVAWYQHL
ncbi:MULTISPECIES: MBL fold metallo-hydrolase [unclassified Pseudomonas]|uniref:MBL fold metallo-hydrolase n=1 Tax=unclassified Pseudomonas TaxID=196821 RepID=UPI00129E5550|nr:MULTISPECIES: MBL fold metallo-hydrolase [unclassified Pseudomonas]MDH4656850.1 MBL fold metallo-hydrolase [Pseudomonas sp. BN606]MRK24023.1 MBL fold metallo-hydrolase [Pseudomonas sp. JG-B]